MIPTIALIGRSNVGKSSLFNLLTGSNSALIDKQFNTTRDRNYGYFLFKNNKFCVIDTAGINYIYKKNDTNSIFYDSYYQTKKAIKDSHFLIFIVDAYDGITNLDFYILKKIRKQNKPIILLINKVDIINDTNQTTEFYNFGIKNACVVSTLRKIGINDFLKKILILWKNLKKINLLKKTSHNRRIPFSSQEKIEICILGKPNVGKSSLINSLLNTDRVLTHSKPGTTRDSIKVFLKKQNKDYIFTDTSGVRKKNKRQTRLEHVSETRSINIMKKSHITMIVIDSYLGICAQDLSIINIVMKFGCPFFIVFNKWDLITKKKRNEIKKKIKHRLKFIKNITYLFVSSLMKTGLKNILFCIDRIYKESMKDFSSFKITKIINKAIRQHPLPMGATGKVTRLKYAHLSSKNPMLIIVHGTQTQNVSLTYKKYLMHFLQKELQILNTPIKLFFKNNINPYINNKY